MIYPLADNCTKKVILEINYAVFLSIGKFSKNFYPTDNKQNLVLILFICTNFKQIIWKPIISLFQYTYSNLLTKLSTGSVD